MPLTALYKDKEINILDHGINDLIKIKKDCVCKFCKNPMFLKNGKKRITHFAHSKNSNCSSEGESYRHLYIKSFVYKNLKVFLFNKLIKELKIESNLNGCRPDVFVKTNKNFDIGIEIQLTPLLSENIIKRSVSNYNNSGISSLWIFDFNDVKKVNTKNRYYGYFDEYGKKAFKVIKLKEFQLNLYSITNKLFFFHDNSYGIMSLSLKDVYPERVYWESGMEYDDGYYYVSKSSLKTFKNIATQNELNFFKLKRHKYLPIMIEK